MQQRNQQSQWRPSWNHQRTLASKPPLRAALVKARSKHHCNRETPPQGLDEVSHQSHQDEEEVLAQRLGCRREPYKGDMLKACETSPLCSHKQDRRTSTIDDERDGSFSPSSVTWLVERIEGIDIAMAATKNWICKNDGQASKKGCKIVRNEKPWLVESSPSSIVPKHNWEYTFRNKNPHENKDTRLGSSTKK